MVTWPVTKNGKKTKAVALLCSFQNLLELCPIVLLLWRYELQNGQLCLWLTLIIMSRLSPFFLLLSPRNLSSGWLLVEWNGTSLGTRSCALFSCLFFLLILVLKARYCRQQATFVCGKLLLEMYGGLLGVLVGVEQATGEPKMENKRVDMDSWFTLNMLSYVGCCRSDSPVEKSSSLLTSLTGCWIQLLARNHYYHDAKSVLAVLLSSSSKLHRLALHRAIAGPHLQRPYSTRSPALIWILHPSKVAVSRAPWINYLVQPRIYPERG